MVEINKLDELIGRINIQEAMSELNKKERLIKNCLEELKFLREQEMKQKEVVLTMKCPKCQEGYLKSVDTIMFNRINEINLDEFEGQDYKCECGYKVHIMAVEPCDKHGDTI